jgi:MFS family permease
MDHSQDHSIEHKPKFRLNRFSAVYHSFPSKFWVLVVAMFIDMIGGTLLHPFFALYITSKFSVGMTTAGIILGVFSISGLVGGAIGGALTDRFGRRSIVIFGLVFSAFSTVALGFVSEISIIYPLAVIIGVIGSIAGPAHQAMVADILPEEKRSEGFGILRVVANLSWIIGPVIGGFIAQRSFLMLFIIDAVISSIVAVIFFKLMPETMPQHPENKEQGSLLQTIAGYRHVARDLPYVAYLVVSILMLLVYQQMYNTLSVFLRDARGISTQNYGYLLTFSAIVVVLFQFWVTTKTKHRPPFLMMALGTVFYMIGFSMFGVFYGYGFFVAAIIIITIGEMVVVPVSQTLAAQFAPEEMRGRYMAFFGLAWALPSAIGPWAAGNILDNFDPNWVWYAGGIISAVAVAGFYLLHLNLKNQKRFQPAEEAAVS